jgi:DNA-binding HxlR family transcriptional regulator
MTGRQTPRPGRGVRGSTTGRPLMAAMDLLGRRWTLRILWELRDGPLGARALRERCDGMSTSVLYDRLGELGDAGLVARTDRDRYVLSAVGAALGHALQPLGRWADDWAAVLAAPSTADQASTTGSGPPVAGRERP